MQKTAKWPFFYAVFLFIAKAMRYSTAIAAMGIQALTQHNTCFLSAHLANRIATQITVNSTMAPTLRSLCFFSEKPKVCWFSIRLSAQAKPRIKTLEMINPCVIGILIEMCIRDRVYVVVRLSAVLVLLTAVVSDSKFPFSS